METSHDEPKAFDIILLLLLRGIRIVTGYEPITFSPKISYPNENQDYRENEEPPNHQIVVYQRKFSHYEADIQIGHGQFAPLKQGQGRVQASYYKWKTEMMDGS